MRQLLLAILALLAAIPVAEAEVCLGPRERREAIASGLAVRLRDAVASVLSTVSGRVVDADLCHTGSGLVYRIAVLEPGGQIRLAIVDARSASLIGMR
jgi:uncharacterized membrane protein YkoI